MSEAVMRRSNLRNYEVISDPGTHVVKVAGSVKPDFIIEDGAKSRYLVNLRVSTIKGFEECLHIMGNRENVPFKDVRHNFMTGALWSNDVDDLERLPAKGESIIATFDYVDDVMRCVSLTLIPRRELNKFDLDAHCNSRGLFKSLLQERK